MGEEGRQRTGAAGSTDREDEAREDEARGDQAPDDEAPENEAGGNGARENGSREDKGRNPSGGAPSLGPNTVLEKREPVEERLARHEQSTEDAMGKDKRRAVVGQSYGPSKTRQLTLYGIFLAVVVAVLIGGALLVNALDTPVGKQVPQSAPWAQPNAHQHPPKPLQ
jgi:hypothetical protein